MYPPCSPCALPCNPGPFSVAAHPSLCFRTWRIMLYAPSTERQSIVHSVPICLYMHVTDFVAYQIGFFLSGTKEQHFCHYTVLLY